MASLVAVVKDFKVDVEIFDSFLRENGLWETFGTRLLPEAADDVSQLFRTKGVEGDIRVFIPHRLGYDNPKCLLVCFDWMLVFAIRELSHDALTKPMPPGLNEIRELLKADCNEVSTWVVYTDEEWPWLQKPVLERRTVRCKFLV